MIMIRHRHFNYVVQMPLVRKSYASLGLAPAIIKQLPHLDKLSLEVSAVCAGLELYVPSSVSNFHVVILSRSRPCNNLVSSGRGADESTGIFISSRYFATVRRVTSMPSACNREVICSSVNGCR